MARDGDTFRVVEELQSVAEEFTDVVTRLETMPLNQRPLNRSRADRNLAQFRTHLSMLQRDFRILPPGLEKATLASDISRFEQIYTANVERLSAAISPPAAAASTAVDVPSSQADSQSRNQGRRPIHGMKEAQSAERRINAAQDEALSELDRGLGYTSQAHEAADDMMTRLRQQTETLENTNAELRTMDGQLSRAKRDIGVFMRRMMTDRLIICFLVLIILIIAGLVGYKIYLQVKK
eukprot:TRINITY_DN34289_c0_g1_i1.p1 TRINITY_DN34289_c0_g1~~TRINITY_DN34289_c0_g1_i1.p1  ORF type:complete len:237 (-),score=40.51 TRINITY_DN34289_c0_g1_i1:126-836(-)